MGWLYGYPSKEEIVRTLRESAQRSRDFTLLKDSLVGSNYWMLVQDQENPDLISIVVAKMESGLHNGRREWGYKTIGEEAGPFVTMNCPKSFLVASTHPNASWREHALLVDENRQLAKKALKPGAVLSLGQGATYKLEQYLGAKGWVASRIEEDGKRYRMPTSHASEAASMLLAEQGRRQYEKLLDADDLQTPVQWRNDDGDPLDFDRLPEGAKDLFINRAAGGRYWMKVHHMLEDDSWHIEYRERRQRDRQGA